MLDNPCDTLPGVGPAMAEKLAKCGILNLQDLLFHLPFRYQDRTRITAIQDLRLKDWAVISGRVCKTEIKQGKKRMLYCYVEDKTGLIRLRFFHFNTHQINALKNSETIRAFGEVHLFNNQLEMIHPEYQLLSSDEIAPVEEALTPIYPSTQGLSQSRIRQLVNAALTYCDPTLHALEWMNSEQLQQSGFQSIVDALKHLHHPPPDTSIVALEQGAHPGLQRLVFDELLAHRLSMEFAREQRAQLSAPELPVAPALTTTFLNQLPFQLTQAQQRVRGEIEAHLTQNTPMLRLVQGDVGAGKTVVSALAAIQAVANQYQVALMAPTDILSEQHAKTMKAWFDPLGIDVQRLSGKMKLSERRIVLNALQLGSCQIVVGTHALFQEGVQFSRLGLVIIDEQHRFGVQQRQLLQQKGQHNTLLPHVLLMTATPIPRTLAMSQFAHLDLSVLDELPPGRTPITTAVIRQERRELIIERLQSAIQEGRQAYWVCTLIEESETLQCQAATETAELLKAQLSAARIGLIHGRMKAHEKETIMLAFKSGALDLLVATTVIEVGVDVPNASLMIIENAERLGLSQLHQLRGRVGRGSVQSHCLLLYQSPISQDGMERLRVMRETTDGFLIAEKDLQLRGAGEVLGTRQTGYRQYKIADLNRDHALLSQLPTFSRHLLQYERLTAKQISHRWLGQFESFLQG